MRSSKAIALDLSVAYSAGEVVAFTVMLDVSASRLVDRLTYRQKNPVPREFQGLIAIESTKTIHSVDLGCGAQNSKRCDNFVKVEADDVAEGGIGPPEWW